MKIIEIEDFRKDPESYLRESKKEDIYIKEGNQIISVLTNPQLHALLSSKKVD